MNIGSVGKNGEDRVAAFLRKNGAKTVERNFRTPFGEIDIIAEWEEYIVFVEVKTRDVKTFVPYQYSVDAYKQQRLRLAAMEYMSKTNTKSEYRFDVAVVIIDGDKFSLDYKKFAF